MSFDNLLTLLIIGGLGYMMFRGGGCCGGHGSHGGHGSGRKHEESQPASGSEDDRAS